MSWDFQVRILHSAEEDNLSPFNSNIACLCQSIGINNNKYVYVYVYVNVDVDEDVDVDTQCHCSHDNGKLSIYTRESINFKYIDKCIMLYR